MTMTPRTRGHVTSIVHRLLMDRIFVGYSSSWMLLLGSLFFILSSSLPRANGQDLYELITTYDGGWRQDGVMFDVQTVRSNSTATNNDAVGSDTSTATPDGITIFGLNMLTPSTEPFCVELYTKSGTFSDDAFDSTSWTFLGSFTILGQGPNTPTEIPLGSFDPVTIGVGEIQAFYVTTQNENVRYTSLEDAEGDIATGDVYASSVPHYSTTESSGNNNEAGPPRTNRLLQSISSDGLSVQILTGVAKNYPFAESWPDRVFNGALFYTIGKDASLSLSEGQLYEALSVQRGPVTCDKDALSPENFPSVAPSEAIIPTAAPVTQGPSNAPTSAAPTTFESTIFKVATTLRGGVKQAGVMFDVHVPSEAEGGPPEGLTVVGFEASTSSTDSVCFEVYSKNGTYDGFELDAQTNANGTWSSKTWESLGASTVTGQGAELPTNIPIGALDPVFVEAGGTRAFYITMTEPEMRYTEPVYGEQTGDLFSGSPDGHIELLVGSAVAYPFQEAWRDRIFNGAVVYALGDVGDNRYNKTASASRKRACPRTTESPTKSPTPAPVVVDIVDDVAAETIVNSTTATTTAVPETGPTEVSTEVVSGSEGDYGDNKPSNVTNGTGSNGNSDSGNSTSVDKSDSDGQTVSAVRGDDPNSSNGEINANYSRSLSTSGIVLVAAFAGVFLLLITALVVVRARKRPRIKRTDSQELFHEFPEEESHVQEALYGVTATSTSGFSQRFSPYLSSSRKSDSPPVPQPAPDQPYANTHHALILNEEDDISLFSSDKSKSRFAPSSLRAPDSPGSRGSTGSKGSNSSRKSVEFVRVGQSFGTTRSTLPEDTVDL